MMNPLDALVLARTKLRSHRIRTGLTVVTAGLLFGLITAALFFIQGIFTSIDAYSDVGLNDRAILNVARSPMYGSFDEYSHLADADFVREVEAAHAAYVSNKQAAAKKYSVPYNPAIEDPSPIAVDPITGQKVIPIESLSTEAVNRAAAARRAANQKPFSMDEYLSEYSSAIRRGMNNTVEPAEGSLTYMKDGKENQTVSSDRFEDSLMSGESGVSLTILDGSITESFITSDVFDASKGEMPVILPFSDAEKLLGLSKLPKEATSEERRERLRHVRDNVENVTATFCYRSNASRALMGQAVSQQEMIKYQSGTEGFVMPALLYNAPDTTDCSGVTIKSDTRSAAEKQAEENRIAFEKELGIWIGEAAQQKITVRGVGISGDTDSTDIALSPATFVTGLLNTNLGYNTWVIPQNLFDTLPPDARPDNIFKNTLSDDRSLDPYRMSGVNTYLVEFTDKSEARALLERTGAYTGGSFGEVMAYPFGSGVLFIDEMRMWVEKILFWALVVVGAIAAITLWAVIGRTIADSRRESAVFRAIGATRFDIASIYSLYALLLSLRVAVFALVLGFAISLGLDIIYSESTTIAAELAYAAVDTGIRFRLFNLFSQYVPVVIGVIVLAGLLASFLPIVFGVRRNPITDMRDDG